MKRSEAFKIVADKGIAFDKFAGYAHNGYRRRNMKKAKCLWLSFIQAWGDLFNLAPQAAECKFEISTKNNNITSHFNAAWKHLANAIEEDAQCLG